MALKEEKRIILSQIPKWESKKIISSDQAKKIRALYQKDGKEMGASSKLIPFIAIFGSLMIGAGILLFFAMNWSEIPKLVKVVSLLGFLAAAYHVGYVMKFSKGNLPRVGEAFIFLGAILFGANIALIAQIFNISSHFPNFFLFWGIGALAIAYTASSLPSLFLALGTLAIYVGSESYYWFEKVNSFFHIEYSFFLIFLSLGILYFSIGSLHERRKDLSPFRYPFHLFGSILILFTIYLLSFKWFGRANEYYNGAGGFDLLFSSQFWTIYLGITLFAGGALAYFALKNLSKSPLDFYECFGLGFLLVFSPIVVLLTKVNFWLVPLLFNVILFVLIILSIYLGHAKKEKTLVNLGMSAFAIALISRYFEYLWDVLNGYLFFIIGGALLIGLSIFLEKKRRSILLEFED